MKDWVLVTGGAVRLGREICLAFARTGRWNVLCHYNTSEADAQAVVRELTALGAGAAAVAGPLDDAPGARAVFDRALELSGGALACVVNNASRFESDAADNFTPEALSAGLDINLVVPLLLGQWLHAHLATRSAAARGALVHLLDQKVFNLNPDYFSYTLSKLALERSVALQAQALAPRLRVNAVAPGLMYPSGPQSLENFGVAAQANLLRSPIDPARVAQAVQFVADNPCITGITLCVDNGQHLVALPRDIMFVTEELLGEARR